jgi:hypothetical protein
MQSEMFMCNDVSVFKSEVRAVQLFGLWDETQPYCPPYVKQDHFKSLNTLET